MGIFTQLTELQWQRHGQFSGQERDPIDSYTSVQTGTRARPRGAFHPYKSPLVTAVYFRHGSLCVVRQLHPMLCSKISTILLRIYRSLSKASVVVTVHRLVSVDDSLPTSSLRGCGGDDFDAHEFPRGRSSHRTRP